jgi:hypothetical protein
MPLYTFIMDYDGGTYVSQAKAPSPKSACLNWARTLDVPQIKGLGGKSHESLIAKMREASPTPLDGVLNTWCATALIRGRLALINIVQTENGRQLSARES